MKGAIVFLVVFAIFLMITLVYPTLPPGALIYNALNVPDSDYPVLGVPVTLLVTAVFNGVVYGFVAWLIYTIVARATKKEKTSTPAQPPAQTQPQTPASPPPTEV